MLTHLGRCFIDLKKIYADERPYKVLRPINLIYDIITVSILEFLEAL